MPVVARGGADSDEPPRQLPRLPPGRHGLPREFVVKNQRDRLTAGMIAVVAELGYHETTISQIATASGVSRRTFYGYFANKEEAFLATYEAISEYLFGAAQAAAAEERGWPARVRAALGAVLEAFAANPDLARFALVVPPRAGEAIAVRYRQATAEAVAALNRNRPKRVRGPSEQVQGALIAGVVALIARRVEAGEGEGPVSELLPEVVELFLTPYLGREAAAAAAAG